MPRHVVMTLSLAIVCLAQAPGDARAQAAAAARFDEQAAVHRGPEFRAPPVRSGAPRSAGRVALGGLLGGGVAAGALGLAGGLAAVALGGCPDDCGPGGLIVGAMVGEVVGLPLGAHLADGRRGSYGLDLLESVVLGGGAVAAGAAGGERSLQVLATAVPVLQLASIAATERHSLSGITVGVKGGLVRSRMAGASGAGARSGGGIGAVVAFDFTEDVALQTELLYLRKGVTATDPTRRSLSAAYVEVPLLVAVTLPPRRSPVRPFVVAGPATAVNLTCDAEPPSPEGYGCQWDFGLAEHDYSLVAGAGVRLPLGGLDGTLELRYDHGLTGNRVGTPTVPPERVARNRALMVLAGIAVPLGRGGSRGVSRVP